jgi:hypothetical protein
MVRRVMRISRRFSACRSGSRLASRSCERFTIFAPGAELGEDAIGGWSDETGGTATAGAGRCSTNWVCEFCWSGPTSWAARRCKSAAGLEASGCVSLLVVTSDPVDGA